MREMMTEKRGGKLKEVTVQQAMPSGPNAIAALRKFLGDFREGEVPVTDALVGLLQGCWHELDGSGDTKMNAGKLDRIEQVRWEPPVLSFVIERHGALAFRSIYAELHQWEVDLDPGA